MLRVMYYMASSQRKTTISSAACLITILCLVSQNAAHLVKGKHYADLIWLPSNNALVLEL